MVKQRHNDPRLDAREVPGGRDLPLNGLAHLPRPNGVVNGRSSPERADQELGVFASDPSPLPNVERGTVLQAWILRVGQKCPLVESLYSLVLEIGPGKVTLGFVGSRGAAAHFASWAARQRGWSFFRSSSEDTPMLVMNFEIGQCIEIDKNMDLLVERLDGLRVQLSLMRRTAPRPERATYATATGTAHDAGQKAYGPYHPEEGSYAMLTNTNEPIGYADFELARRVTNFLHARRIPGAEEVKVVANGGTIVITGKLPGHARRPCVECCRHVAGVVRLIDALEEEGDGLRRASL